MYQHHLLDRIALMIAYDFAGQGGVDHGWDVRHNRLLTQISKETGARIGGTVYSDALSAPDGPAPTYLAMFRHNLEEFTRALTGS
jgi:hypothetical protein